MEPTPRPRARGRPAGRDHAAIAKAWGRDITAGKIPAGSLLLAAVKRQESDLFRQGTPDFPYVYRPELGAKACRFLEHLKHVKGPLADKAIILDPWEVWFISVALGWVHAITGHPRFRELSVWLNRGQGKSLIAAGLGLYVLNEGKGGEVVCAATTRDQARVVFDVARYFCLKSPELAKRLGFEIGQHAITQPATASFLKPVSSEAGTQEGGNYAAVILDELHAHGTRALHDTLKTGCGKRPDSRFIVISTAPTDLASVGYETWSYARDILRGTVKDESVFAFIVAADEGDDPWSESTWRKANPGFGISIDPGYFEGIARKAQAVASLRPAFFSRHLGWVVNTQNDWVRLEVWDKAGDAPPLSAWEGEIATIGLDLGRSSDLTARVTLFTKEGEDGRAHVYAYLKTYIHEQAILEGRNQAYAGWAEDGHITVTEGNQTNYDLVEADILADAGRYSIHEIAVDPWESAQMATHFESAGLTVVAVRPIYAMLSEPMKALEGMLLDGRFHHDNNPVFRWAVSNVRVRTDGKDNILPVKENPDSHKKIDPIVALLSALARILVVSLERPSAYTL